MSHKLLHFPRRETQDVSPPLAARPGDQFMLVELSDDAFSGTLGKGARVLVAKGRIGKHGLMAVRTCDARLLIRHVEINLDGTLVLSCHNYPPRHYELGNYELLGRVIQFYEHEADGYRWELVRDEDIHESIYVRPLLRLPG